ncbi:unnamed protein product [Pedinophyceae sp. YPF-701]|nr:unnamed protein product [Pedinophyceae sp. YPF-701]
MPPKKQAAPEVPQEPPKPLEGKFHYPSGATYEGEYMHRLKEGETAVPEGETRPRYRHGKGTFIEGDYKYEGNWEDDKMCGKGSFVFASGARYDGEFKDNKYHGTGTYKWSDGRQYEGGWEEGKMHGKGVYLDREGHRWEGQFFNGAGPGLTQLLEQ